MLREMGERGEVTPEFPGDYAHQVFELSQIIVLISIRENEKMN